ncbi:MAG: dTMP kinase [Lentisphaerae bacterium]|nr:dTMP kinase [Lentisphaerota bacterium]
MRGLFMTFEGPEGSGKTTQAAALVQRLRAAGYRVEAPREPGGTSTGEAIRGILQHDTAGEPICPEAEVLLFAASRAHLVRRVILPALETGAVVVCDRFGDSTTAYQGYGRRIDVDVIRRINALALDGAVPDLTFLLDVEFGTGFARLTARRQAGAAGEDRFERESQAFHERVRAGYLELAEQEPDRFVVVPTNRPRDAVAGEIWTRVQERFGERLKELRRAG